MRVMEVVVPIGILVLWLLLVQRTRSCGYKVSGSRAAVFSWLLPIIGLPVLRVMPLSRDFLPLRRVLW